MAQFRMAQGDQRYIPFGIQQQGTPISNDSIIAIEFTVGNLIKIFPGEVIYNEQSNTYNFPVMQEETFQFKNVVDYQVRIKYNGDDDFTNVIGSNIGKIDVLKSLSKNII